MKCADEGCEQQAAPGHPWPEHQNEKHRSGDGGELAAKPFMANIQLKITQRPVDESDMSWDCARCTTTTEAPGEMVWLELEGVGNWAVCPPCWAEIAQENAVAESRKTKEAASEQPQSPITGGAEG